MIILFTRQRVGAFLGTDLDQYLCGRGVTQVFLSRRRHKRRCGSGQHAAPMIWVYNVVLVMDAMDGSGRRYAPP